MSDASLRAPSRSPRMRRRTRILVFFVPLLLILGLGGYSAACAFAPLPAPEFTLLADEEVNVTVDDARAQAVVDAESSPTAIGWSDGDADDVWANSDDVYPLASISKVIMMLVALEHKPLEPGSDGDTYVWTAEDAALTAEYSAVGGVTHGFPIGTELTQRDLMQYIFLPSANDVAHSYALWTFGSNEAFLEAFETWKAEHGLESLTLVEPTGMDDANRASAADLVRVARLALDEPTISEFTALQKAETPWGAGTIENTNPLLGVLPGIVGLKTGTLYSSYNFIAAQEVEVHGRDVVSISVTLDRDSLEARAADGQLVLGSMADLPEEVPVVEAGELIGTLTSVQGQSIELLSSDAAQAVLLPGETATRTVNVVNDWDINAEEAGAITVASPEGETEVPIHRTGSFTEPDLWWRLTHPFLLFG